MNATGNSTGCLRAKCLFTTGERVAIVIFFSVIFIASLVGNCILFVAIIRNKRLRRSSTNFSFLSLSFANILITIFCIPVFTIDAFIAESWLFGSIGCKLVNFLQTMSINAAILTLLVISVEKFLVVYFPFQFRSQRTKVRYLVFFAWILGIIHTSVYLSYRKVQEINGVQWCFEQWPSPDTGKIYIVAQVFVLRFAPLMFMMLLHALTIKRIKARLQYRRSSDEEGNFNGPGTVQISSHALKIRKKAVVMLVVVVTAATVTLFPFNILACWRALANPKITDLFSANLVYSVTLWLMYFNSASHPIIFGLMSTEYRKAAKSSFRSFVRKSSAPSRIVVSSSKKKKEEPIIMTALASGSA